MSKKSYRKKFGDFQQGYLSAFSIFRQPLAQKLDPVLSTEDHSNLQDAVIKSCKGQLVTLLLSKQLSANKALIINTIARLSNKELCVVDCSELTNKYIGETEKNLARIFADAQTHNWVLFFDEADALFGRGAKGAANNEQFANQEVSYLFKLFGQHSGLYILAVDQTEWYEQLQHRVTYRLKSLPVSKLA
tara:strand:+ start:855 stop:1424 length:570 start_codon:yes stop_codon:yes gene_type:complete